MYHIRDLFRAIQGITRISSLCWLQVVESSPGCQLVGDARKEFQVAGFVYWNLSWEVYINKKKWEVIVVYSDFHRTEKLYSKPICLMNIPQKLDSIIKGFLPSIYINSERWHCIDCQQYFLRTKHGTWAYFLAIHGSVPHRHPSARQWRFHLDDHPS